MTDGPVAKVPARPSVYFNIDYEQPLTAPQFKQSPESLNQPYDGASPLSITYKALCRSAALAAPTSLLRVANPVAAEGPSSTPKPALRYSHPSCGAEKPLWSQLVAAPCYRQATEANEPLDEPHRAKGH